MVIYIHDFLLSFILFFFRMNNPLAFHNSFLQYLEFRPVLFFTQFYTSPTVPSIMNSVLKPSSSPPVPSFRILISINDIYYYRALGVKSYSFVHSHYPNDGNGIRYKSKVVDIYIELMKTWKNDETHSDALRSNTKLPGKGLRILTAGLWQM